MISFLQVESVVLTDKQYEGIGRLALAINDIEASVDIYLPFIVGAPELGVSFLFSEEARLSRKLDRFKKVLEAIREERPALEREFECILDLMEKAKKVLEERNSYVHAFAYIDLKSREPKLKIRRRKITAPDEVITCDEEAIFRHAAEAMLIAISLTAECERLGGLLAEVRRSHPRPD